MLRTTTLLIVMVLAGGPSGSLACELWCTTAAADAHHRAVGCHDASAASATGQQIESAAGCHDAAVITSFVTEARQTESTSVAAAPLTLFRSASIDPDNDASTAGWCPFKVQPPRQSSPRTTVLRV